MARGPHPAPIRVLRLIARLNVGGPARHVALLMAGLDQARFEQLLVAGRVQGDEDDMGPALKAQGVDYLDLAELGRSLHPWRDLKGLHKLLGIMARFRPQVVETHTSKAGFLGRVACGLYRPYARLRGWPLPKAIHTFHGHTFHGYFSPLTEKVFLTLERLLAKLATWRIVVISPRQYQEICQTYGVGQPGQYLVLPLGINLAPFADPGLGRAAFRAQLGLGERDFLVGAVGRVAPVKNYALLLAAAAALRETHPGLFDRTRWVLIGGGPAGEVAELQALAARLGLGERVLLLGSRLDPERFMAGLDALLLTSLNEGTPMVILEAGACAQPVVATEVGGVPDLLGRAVAPGAGGFTRRQRGLTAPSGDGAALAAALAWLLEHPGEARDLGGALKDYVWSQHNRQRLLEDVSRLYEQAAAG
jgi:glycosyltransferase involved in cell wall biosynthesis